MPEFQKYASHLEKSGCGAEIRRHFWINREASAGEKKMRLLPKNASLINMISAENGAPEIIASRLEQVGKRQEKMKRVGNETPKCAYSICHEVGKLHYFLKNYDWATRDQYPPYIRYTRGSGWLRGELVRFFSLFLAAMLFHFLYHLVFY